MGQGFITNWGSFVLLQIGASVITNWGSLVITKWGRRYYKLGQLLQISATVITIGAILLQIRAAITNWGSYYKLEHNRANQQNFMDKELNQAIMVRSKLRNKYRKSK